MKPDITFGDFSSFANSAEYQKKAIAEHPENYAASLTDEDTLIKSQAFGDFKKKISSYIYSFLRTLEFEACWLISCRSIDFKILLGEKMGFDAVCLEALHNRIFEKLTFKYLPTASLAYAHNFATAISLQNEHEIASFLYALAGNLEEDIHSYLMSADQNADQPTVITLMNIRSGLVSQIEQLKKWSHKTFFIERISTSPDKISSYLGVEEIPEIINFPGRSANLNFNESSIVNHQSYADLMIDPEKLRRFSHYVYMDVEVAAMEVCAKNIVAYRQMPLDFKLDMARQIWDEARHAIIMRRLLKESGGKEGDYTYSAKVWKKCEKGANLAERLAIQQVFQEGNALESNFLLTDAFKNAGNLEMTRCMDFINADEAVHVKIGNFWMKYLLDGNYDAYQATMEKATNLVKATLSSNVELNRTARKISDFPDAFVDILEQNNQVYGYRKS